MCESVCVWTVSNDTAGNFAKMYFWLHNNHQPPPPWAKRVRIMKKEMARLVLYQEYHQKWVSFWATAFMTFDYEVNFRKGYREKSQ